MIAWWEERFNMGRAKATVLVCSSIFLLGIATVWSFNLWADWRPLAAIGKFSDFGYFEILDYLTANVMMPLCGLLLCLFAGWRIRPEALAREIGIENPVLYRLWYWLLRWLAPIAIAAVLIGGL
jgi:NSS family neurotransmitter:Na+ symporter